MALGHGHPSCWRTGTLLASVLIRFPRNDLESHLWYQISAAGLWVLGGPSLSVRVFESLAWSTALSITQRPFSLGFSDEDSLLRAWGRLGIWGGEGMASRLALLSFLTIFRVKTDLKKKPAPVKVQHARNLLWLCGLPQTWSKLVIHTKCPIFIAILPLSQTMPTGQGLGQYSIMDITVPGRPVPIQDPQESHFSPQNLTFLIYEREIKGTPWQDWGE